MIKILLILIFCSLGGHAWASKPALLLANVYNPKTHHLRDYWVSEKYDGVRAFWDGKKLITRGGQTVQLPQALAQQLPHLQLDGELWIAHNHFEDISALVRTQNAQPNQWSKVTYLVFDLPAHPGTFDQRLTTLKTLHQQQPSTFWQPVMQYKLTTQQQLTQKLKTVEQQGGEGLMLHKGASYYKAVRGDDLLKVKSYEDAEATVIAHIEGKGKYQGMLGALKVRTPKGLIFKIGSGFTDKERATPPPIGSQITYKYYGYTQKGTPRFASFLRVKQQH